MGILKNISKVDIKGGVKVWIGGYVKRSIKIEYEVYKRLINIKYGRQFSTISDVIKMLLKGDKKDEQKV